nr:hypothetical protein [Coxiella endosymbiont of Ornithodoros amblus]
MDNYNKLGDQDQQKISGVLQALLLQYACPELDDIKEVLIKVAEYEKGIKQALENHLQKGTGYKRKSLPRVPKAVSTIVISK